MNLNNETIAQLLDIGIDPVAAARGTIYGPSGHFYRVDHFWQEARGIKIFRVVDGNGKMCLKTDELLKEIFAS